MEARESQGEFRDILELVERWLASPFDVVVSFLAAFAEDDNRVDAEETRLSS